MEFFKKHTAVVVISVICVVFIVAYIFIRPVATEEGADTNHLLTDNLESMADQNNEAQTSMENGGTSDNGAEVAQTRTTASGLSITDIKIGDGAVAESGKVVVVHYTGTLDDGAVFDSSVGRGEPFGFVLGVGQVIKGWDEGVAGMKVGGKRTLVIPASLAYGVQGVSAPDGTVVIPGGATLTFDVELLGIQEVSQE